MDYDAAKKADVRRMTHGLTDQPTIEQLSSSGTAAKAKRDRLNMQLEASKAATEKKPTTVRGVGGSAGEGRSDAAPDEEMTKRKEPGQGKGCEGKCD